jgi:ferritin-like metal-binding protein YciE
MASEKNLQELFHETLKDIYFAEKKILSALPKMAKAAQSQGLKAAFEKHESETEEHVARLEKVFEEIDETPRGKIATRSWASSRKAREVMKKFKGARLLSTEVCSPRRRRSSITRLPATGHRRVRIEPGVELLETTLGEEKETDETLTKTRAERGQPTRASRVTET